MGKQIEINDPVSNCIDAWVQNRKKPLCLNMQDPIVFTYYKGQEISMSDPRISKFMVNEVGNRYQVYIWLQ